MEWCSTFDFLIKKNFNFNFLIFFLLFLKKNSYFDVVVHDSIIFGQQSHIGFLYRTEATDLHETVVQHVQYHIFARKTNKFDILKYQKENILLKFFSKCHKFYEKTLINSNESDSRNLPVDLQLVALECLRQLPFSSMFYQCSIP